MHALIQEIDVIAGIETKTTIPAWLERLAFLFLFLMALTAPHSIAASQTSWLLGMVFWMSRYFFSPRPKFVKTILFAPMLALYGWTVISAVFSYAPDISTGKLRSASLFIIFFFVVNNIRTHKAARLIAIALISSCMISVIWMPVERLIGRGVEIRELTTSSPLLKTVAVPGDALLEANGKKISNPGQLVQEIESSGSAKITFYRPDFYYFFELKSNDLQAGGSPEEKLGIAEWKTGRKWRSAGFYGAYFTYAEVLQLIGSLTIGLLIAGFGFTRTRKSSASSETDESPGSHLFGLSRSNLALFLCSGLMGLALLLTATRGPQAGLIVSAAIIVFLGIGRKAFFILAALAVPLVIGGAIFLQQTRNVGVVDLKDNSTTWRLTVYKEGFDLWTKNARNFTVGVGMDSLKRFKEEWHLFDDGKLPSGHFHSTPLQLVVERGLPALCFWLWMFALFLWSMFGAIRKEELTNWVDKGIVLGSIGGVAGFLLSSVVHYNFGDGEVAMVLYLLMGLGVASITVHKTPAVSPDLPE